MVNQNILLIDIFPDPDCFFHLSEQHITFPELCLLFFILVNEIGPNQRWRPQILRCTIRSFMEMFC